MELNGKIEKFTVTAENFNTLLSVVYRCNRKLAKIASLNTTVNQWNQIIT